MKNPDEAWILPVGQYRSRSEYFFAKWCERWCIPFTYEPECFQIPGPTGPVRYIPDFYLTESNIWVEVKPAIFKGELWKFEKFLETIPSFWSWNDKECKSGDSVPDDLAVGWVVEICNQEPKVVCLYADLGTEECEEWIGLFNGFCTCNQCGRPFILSQGLWRCHHCLNGGKNCWDMNFEYHPERLTKSIKFYRSLTQSERIAVWKSEKARIEGETKKDNPF